MHNSKIVCTFVLMNKEKLIKNLTLTLEETIGDELNLLVEQNKILAKEILDFRQCLIKNFNGLTQEFILREFDNNFKSIKYIKLDERR